MLVILEGAYREMDAVFCTNGLNSMEVTYKDTQVCEGDDGIYLDVFSNKVLPFDLDTTAKAVWDHFKGADKHRLRSIALLAPTRLLLFNTQTLSIFPPSLLDFLGTLS
ncbi:hypothetical protein PI126_g22129 [Phytophthora idaei]|nr:hypothetical protein PI126_g22129 [Phytophthora idaei]